MSADYGLVVDPDKLDALVDGVVRRGQPFAVDIETGYYGPDRPKGSLVPEKGAFVVGFSLTNNPRWARYVPVAHDFGENCPQDRAADALWRALRTGNAVAHNAEFELRHLTRWLAEHASAEDRPAPGRPFPMRSDTMLELHAVREQRALRLKYVVEQIFNHKMAAIDSLFPGLTDEKRECIRFNILDQADPAVISYACEDAAWELALHLRHYRNVKDNFIYKLEMAVLECVVEMEADGIDYDWPRLQKALREAQEIFPELDEELHDLIRTTVGVPGLTLNLNSPKQLSDLLYNKLQLPVLRVTKGSRDKPKAERSPSTDALTLEALSGHPVVAGILSSRSRNKLLGSYLQTYEAKYRCVDGKVHPSMSQIGALTGRFSVSEPAYHSTPHGNTEDGYLFETQSGKRFQFKFRDLIISPPGSYIIGYDFSQIELRVIAGEAQEPYLLRAFAEDRDVHAMVGALLKGVPEDDVPKPVRRIGKTLNFALSFMLSVKSLADRLGVPVEEAKDLYDRYYALLSGLSAWRERVIAEAKRTGYATTRFGRRVPIFEFADAKTRAVYEHGIRLAVNAGAQGGAADYVKAVMVRTRKALRRAGLEEKVRLRMMIHDALYWVADDSVTPEQVVEVIEPASVFPVEGWPAMKTDWFMGDRLGGLKPLSVLSAPEAPEPEPPTRDLVVELAEMPSAVRLRRFMELVTSRPGPTGIVIRTPEGDVPLAVRAALSVRDRTDISLAFGGARVKLSADIEDMKLDGIEA